MVTFAIVGVGAFLMTMMLGVGLIAALGFGFAAGCGLPFWMLSFLKKRRESKFLNEFPDAVDVIVRGIKAGLPLLDSLKLISNDATEPVRSEFRAIVETQTIGMPIGEACLKLYERMPLPEANFFGIVVSIQQRVGGNLSEALGNLSARAARPQEDEGEDPGHVDGGQSLGLDHRRPADLVMSLVWLTSPNYIDLLFTEPSGA